MSKFVKNERKIFEVIISLVDYFVNMIPGKFLAFAYYNMILFIQCYDEIKHAMITMSN